MLSSVAATKPFLIRSAVQLVRWKLHHGHHF
jgi:hypothetical protein